MLNPNYSWKEMPSNYKENYFNSDDFRKGKPFIVIDNKTGKEYTFPIFQKNKISDGYYIGQIIVDNDLWNEEFMAWILCTTKDYAFYVNKECVTPEVLDYVVENFEFPEIFSEITIETKMTETRWKKVYERNKEVISYIPRHLVNSEMIEYLSTVKNAKIYNIPYDKLTPELFEKIYFNSDNEHRIALMKKGRSNVYDYNSVPIENLVTEKIARDILSLDISEICHVPQKFITLEDAAKAMDESPVYLKYFPASYQTLEYQKRLIDYKPERISIIEPTVLYDETIYYALSKKAAALSSVPIERRTYDICKYAVSRYGLALRVVPNEFKTEEMCLLAVINDKRAIKYVPIQILTPDFLAKLSEYKITFTKKENAFIENAIDANRILNGEQIITGENQSNNEQLDIDPEIANTQLKSIPGLLSAAASKYLALHKIYTVGALLNCSNDVSLYNKILDTNNPKPKYGEIRGAIRLLRCKYYGIDPIITYDQNSEDIDDLREFFSQIGLSFRAFNALIRARINLKELFDIMNGSNPEEAIKNYRNAGELVAAEVVLKVSIVMNYYNEKNKKENSYNTEDEELAAKMEELNQIYKQIEELDRIKLGVMARIQELQLAKNKGGVSK